MIYKQLHQILDAMEKGIDLESMISSCIEGMQERDRQNDEPVRSEEECRKEIESAIKARAQELREQKLSHDYWSDYQRLADIAVDFAPGMRVKAGQLKPVRYDGKLYDVVQSHTTQSDWAPDAAPALFSEIVAPTEGLDCPEFQQPTSENPYNTGDCVAYTDGYYYESIIDNNVWSPDDYPAGWEQIGAVEA